jgi:hypothetical protein
MAVIMGIILIMFAYSQWEDDVALSYNQSYNIDESGADSSSVSREKLKDLRLANSILNVDCAFLNNAQNTASAVRHQLETYWDISQYPNFKSMMHIPDKSWNIQKAKFTKLILEAGTNRAIKLNTSYSNTLPFEPNFVVGFSGSSVTAGHGMCFFSIDSRACITSQL